MTVLESRSEEAVWRWARRVSGASLGGVSESLVCFKAGEDSFSRRLFISIRARLGAEFELRLFPREGVARLTPPIIIASSHVFPERRLRRGAW